ncbi:MAG: hypothetical protein ACYDDZ_06595 [Acidimicrobiales bacterium]
MKAESGATSETVGRSNSVRGWKIPRLGKTPWWVIPLALIAVLAMVVTSAAMVADPPRIAQQEWSAINLSFGNSPLSQQLEIQFARVSYIDQPTQFNTSAFAGASLTANSSFVTNSSGYGIIQFNSTTAKNASASYPIGGFLGANVSYAFVDQRAALNGTGTTWTLELSESKVVTGPPTVGNVSNKNASASQNAIWLTATYSAGNYTFSVSDFEEKHGGFQTLTAVNFPSNDKLPPLQFFEVYFYAQKLQTVVSLVNTTDAAVIGSETIHPVLDGNLTRLGYLTDVLSMKSGTDAAMILDSTFLVDHNAFASAPGAQGAVGGVRPLVAGALSSVATAPFDPAVASSANYTQGPSGSNSYSNVNASLSAFSSVLNSSNPASETSSALDSSLILNHTTSSTVAFANQSLTTLRAQAETTGVQASSTLYLTSWTPSTIVSQISSFLTSYISARTGVPADNVEIQSYLISNVTVQTTFSSQAATTIHNYLASAIPGFLQSNNLALVNQTTGAIDAGADIGQFMNLATGAVYAGSTNSVGGVFDPVNGLWYGSAEAAGFPVGSGVSVSGSIYVPGQAAFLGWTAAGVPEFGPGGCFIVCMPSIGSALSGAAAATSSFFGSAAKTVTNAVGTVANTVSNDVIKPVSSNLGTDIGGFFNDVSKASSNVMPFFGGTIQNVAGAVTGTLSHGLSSMTGSIASAASGAAGAILSGVNSVGNTIYHLGGSVGSAISNGANAVVNTLGNAVNTAGAVLSPYFASVANLPGAVYSAATNAGKGLWSLGSSIAGAGMNALDSVGHTIQQGLGGAWSMVTNALGSLGSDIMNGLGSLFAGLNPFNWLSGLGSTVSELITIVIIVVVVVIAILAIVLVLRHRKGRKSGRQVGARKSGHRRASRA